MSDEIKKLVEGFFSNLKCNLGWAGGVLTIEGVSKDFENYYGKKSPYHFVFSGEAKDGQELIAKGSHLLKAMASFLESKGQTTLLKINYNVAKEDIFKFIKFKNCEMSSFNKEPIWNFIYRFTFQTTLQYLNDKEQVIHSIYVQNNKVIDFDMENLPIIDGKKEEIKIEDIKQDYGLAKDNLKIVLEKKIQETGDYLDKKLEKEVFRIKEHYKNQLNELDQLLIKTEAQIEQLKQKNNEENEKKIEKLKDNLEKLRNQELRDKLVKEEKFFINDEIHKHSLNISNSLINTTVIYYPIFNISIWLKNACAQRRIDLIYNPLTNQLNSVECEVCKKELAEIVLCSSGHVACSFCFGTCAECNKEFCKNCLSRVCSHCNKKLCLKCSAKCLKCGKFYCLNHIKKDAKTREVGCVNCLKKCYSCGEFAEILEKCPNCGRLMCSNCLKREAKRINGKVYCASCSQLCSTCGKYREYGSFKRCVSCRSDSCNFQGKCLECRKQLCSRCQRI